MTCLKAETYNANLELDALTVFPEEWESTRRTLKQKGNLMTSKGSAVQRASPSVNFPKEKLKAQEMDKSRNKHVARTM